MIKKALVYRVGSVLIGYGLNMYFFDSLQRAAFVTLVFTVVLTAYYYAFHRIWS